MGRNQLQSYCLRCDVVSTLKMVSGLFLQYLVKKVVIVLLASQCMLNCPIFDLIQHEVQ